MLRFNRANYIIVDKTKCSIKNINITIMLYSIFVLKINLLFFDILSFYIS